MIKQSVAGVFCLFLLAGCMSAAGEPESIEEPAVHTERGGTEKRAPEEDSVPEKAPESSMVSESAPEAEAPLLLREASDSTGTPVPSASGLRAGYSDDNRQYGYFMEFLEEYSSVPHTELAVNERIILEVTDLEGTALPDAGVIIRNMTGGRVLRRGVTHADGSYLFFPGDIDSDAERFEITVSFENTEERLIVDRGGPRTVQAAVPVSRGEIEQVPVDVLFIMDTTGSMGEEISRLKNTIELIHLNLQSLPGSIDLRFGMVLYKDIGDDYVTSLIPLTSDLEDFQAALDGVYASGGGDHPEDLQAALIEAVSSVTWNPRGVRLGYIITDAPPHLDYAGQQSYADSARKALEKGIKLHSVGTGGLDLNGEYILRQIAQYTGGRYIFLTYGERGESEGGAPGSVSHHTGANFTTDKLESIIIRFTREEISSYMNAPLPEPDPYISADKIEDEEKEETLSKLFSMSLEQLVDYSSIALDDTLSTAVLPIRGVQEGSSAVAEYFTQQLILEADKSKRFILAERKNLQAILDEFSFQLSGYTDPDEMIEIGGMLNARYLVIGELFSKENSYELYLRLVRVETGEILSVTKAVIDSSLGL